MRKISILISVLLIALYSCVDPFEGEITPAFEGLPVANLLAKDTTGTYTQWVKILENTDLFNTMNLDDNYTCFVPNDSAVQNYLQKNNWMSVDEIPVATAKYLVKYHTIRGKVIEQSLFDNGAIADTTATGDQLTIQIRGGGLNAIYVNGEAHIHKFDIKATNGIIHELDDVITPVTETIWEMMEKNGYSIIKEAISLTGYSQTLNTVFVNETNPNTGVAVQKKMSYTFFAVSDQVFSQKGIQSLADLCNVLGEPNTEYTNPGNKLNQYVAYHILAQQLDYNSLSTFPSASSAQNIQTMAANQLINVSLVSDNIVINSNISFVKYNVTTKNGVLHEINDLMVVKTPPQVNVSWELTDFSDLAALFTGYRKLGESTSTSYISKGDISSINWEAIPSDNNNVAVGYLIRGKSDETYSQLVNYDAIVLNLGTYGWAEFTSPTIIAGKYNVSIFYLSRAAVTPNGKISAVLDGNPLGSEIATHGASAIKTEMRSANLGVVSFNETTTHKFKLLASDNASTVIDYIKFEPVN